MPAGTAGKIDLLTRYRCSVPVPWDSRTGSTSANVSQRRTPRSRAHRRWRPTTTNDTAAVRALLRRLIRQAAWLRSLAGKMAADLSKTSSWRCSWSAAILRPHPGHTYFDATIRGHIRCGYAPPLAACIASGGLQHASGAASRERRGCRSPTGRPGEVRPSDRRRWKC